MTLAFGERSKPAFLSSGGPAASKPFSGLNVHLSVSLLWIPPISTSIFLSLSVSPCLFSLFLVILFGLLPQLPVIFCFCLLGLPWSFCF